MVRLRKAGPSPECAIRHFDQPLVADLKFGAAMLMANGNSPAISCRRSG